MEIKIGFYLENTNIPHVDLSQPSLGNPGCGGTEYLFVALPYYLAKHSKISIERFSVTPIIMAENNCYLPQSIQNHKISGFHEAAKKAKELKVDYFIFRPRRFDEKNTLKIIDYLQLPTIGWCHVTPSEKYLRDMAETYYFKSLVCVEHEQYDAIQDSKIAAITNKCTFIKNGFDSENFSSKKQIQKNNNLVVYLGALVPQKGFHKLAKVWPKVIKRVPTAELKVIGSATLYKHETKLGPWNIAEKDYEEKHIIPHLRTKDGHPMPSVTFLGRLGLEKKEIIKNALIGIPNPTGASENCPGSALEFQASGTVVVSGAYWGMLDTVINKKTGLLGKTEKDLENDIVYFLDNPNKALEFGLLGKAFVQEKYNWDGVINEWISLFQDINCKNSVKRKPFKNNYFSHYKYLVILNRIFQKLVGNFISWPTVNELKIILKKYF